MLNIRHKNEHHRMQGGWLDARWHFSFSDYYDPQNLNFGPLRVFNDDLIDGESGFPMHPHREMEIVTLIQGGVLTHYDSTGNHGEIRPGEVQKMSAGTGIQHSEWNYASEPVRLQQIWFLPGLKGIRPSYAQQRYQVSDAGLTVVASPWAALGGVPIYQDVVISLMQSDAQGPVTYDVPRGRGLYLFAVGGESAVDGEALRQGDAARVLDQERVQIAGGGRVLIIDVPVIDGADRFALMRELTPATTTE
ncbi:MAG: pirin family protein [Dehalococcoidia bacterium]